MAPKARRNRRIISSNPAPAVVVNQAVGNKPLSTSASKPSTVESFITTSNFTRDVKWTGIVTLIIAILIIVALFVVPH